MHIEELIIDGFKSYATRTVISNWDKEFNAITGLNGSGKSNILDAICFVLGIDDLKKVRAATLQDLVYKRGQAGITKASVTLIFNNADRAKSPIGFEQCEQLAVTRQIVIGGKNKYMINGHSVPQKSIENLFQSVGLNIGNPHFLIMQGQITKVLNMKPPEILALIEEAAGTRMFEDRKEKALQTFSKKESKVKEIGQLLNEIIQPKLDKLREERAIYIEYQNLESEIQKLKKASIVLEYSSSKYKAESSHESMQTVTRQLEGLVELEAVLDADLERTNQMVHKLQESEASQKTKGRLEVMEEELKNLANELVRVKTQCELENAQYEEDKKQLESLKRQAASEANKMADPNAALQLKRSLSAAKAQHEACLSKVGRLEELVQSLSTGLSNKEGGYSQYIREAKEEIIQTEAQVTQSSLRIAECQRELEEMQKQHPKSKIQFAKLEAEQNSLANEVNSMKLSLDQMPFDAESFEFTQKQLRLKEQELLSLEQQLRQVEQFIGSINFKYSPPSADFDHSKVKGLVANLVKVPDSKSEYSTALEVTAGGRLYNVVVENETVASQLLEHGRLAKRVTIIPLNKVAANRIPRNLVEEAKASFPRKVELALDIVGYEKEVEKAMEFVFGSTFVCHDKDTANTLAFDKRFKSRCVTLEGDFYDPSGTLTGGSVPSSGGSILSKLSLANTLQAQISNLQNDLHNIRESLKNQEFLRSQFMELQNSWNLKSHKLELVKQQLQNGASAKACRLFDKLQVELQQLQETRGIQMAKKESLKKDLLSFTENEKDSGRSKAERLEQLLKQLKKEKEICSSLTEEVNKLQKQMNLLEKNSQLMLEMESDNKRRIQELEAALKNFVKKSVPNELRFEYEKLEGKVSNERDRIRLENTQLRQAELKKKDLSDRLADLTLEKKQLQLEAERLEKNLKELDAQVKLMESKYPFILNLTREEISRFKEEKHADAGNSKLLKQMEERLCKLSRNFNPQVMGMIDSVEKKEGSLLSMLATVKKDRLKIEHTIGKLNEHKKEALLRTWRKVNEDFGSIFQDLLPGAFAKLEPLNGSLTEGMVVHVSLGGIWKNSLSELSGGQRSLVALALILSLLQYNPAPMYILDEVDAALDLSHTQNIGSLLKMRFKGSQFIVVSLKDGMFSNANCLFRTKFKDGVSAVERYANYGGKQKGKLSGSRAKDLE